MKCGSAYLLYDDEAPDSTPHLHVVISDPDENDRMILVSITTERAKSDTTTRLEARTHPSIVKPSVIAYHYSKILSCAQLKKLIEADASNDIVKRAQAGMQETRRAPREVQECFFTWWAKQDHK